MSVTTADFFFFFFSLSQNNPVNAVSAVSGYYY
jgi:hypothetical protein